MIETLEKNYLHENVRPQASFNDFIFTIDNSLDELFCRKVIQKFNQESGIYDGRIGGDRRIDKKVKQTKDFVLSESSIWEKEDDVFYKALKDGLDKYHRHIRSIHKNALAQPQYQVKDTGYKLQRYEPGGFYDWHNDWSMQDNASRIYVFMWYLNTIKKEDGGYTEFGDGTRLQPKCGTLVVFPATWTYLHRGFPPKVRKYICNGWIYSKP